METNYFVKPNKYDLNILLPFFIMVCIISSILLHCIDLRSVEDYYFLYNRARQMLECIQDGNSFLFFYKDLNGVGYGSSFFYGFITLIPFLPFVNMGYNTFFTVYFLVTGFLFCSGSLFLAKKFSKNYIYIVSIYLLSTFIVEMFYTVGLITNYFAIGIGFFFLGFCVDFFRDKKNILLVSFTYFLLLNTHLLTSVICFFCCVLLLIFYFDKNRLKEYLDLFVNTCIFCWFYIYNFVIHLDKGLNFNSTTIERLYSNNDNKVMFKGTNLMFMDIPFLNLFSLNGTEGYSILGFFIFIICLFIIFKNRKSFSFKELLVLYTFVLGCIIGLNFIWNVIMTKFNCIVQFPMRIIFFLLFFFLIVVFRKLDNKNILIFCVILSLPNLLLEFYVQQSSFEANLKNIYNSQIINGEYLYNNFDLSFDNFDYYRSTVEDEQNKKYDFVLDNKYLYAKVSNETDIDKSIRLPKLYYKGYICEYDIGNKIINLDIENGKNQFITVNIPPNTSGVLKLYYNTKYLDLLFILNLIGIFSLVFCRNFFNFKNKIEIK